MGIFHNLNKFFQCKFNRTETKTKRAHRTTLSVDTLEDRCCPAPLTIQLDYSYDSNNFFDSSSRRAQLERAANTIGALIDDDLDAIRPTGSNTWSATFENPATGANVTKSNLQIPADTIIVYVGARNLDGRGGTLAWAGPGAYSWDGATSWGATVKHRGKSTGAFSTWGGQIIFDTSENWYSGIKTSGLDSDENDFLSVALHEFGHVLGLDHLREGTKDSEGFEAALDPSTNIGTRKLYNEKDLDYLASVGWELDRDFNGKISSAASVGDNDFIWTTTRSGNSVQYSTDSYDIEDPLDVDMFELDLTAGQTLTVSTKAPETGTGLDTYLRLFNSSGKELVDDDDGGPGRYSKFTYKIPSNGRYYFGVSSYPNLEYSAITHFSRSLGGEPGGFSLVVDITNTSSGDDDSGDSSRFNPDVADLSALRLEYGFHSAGTYYQNAHGHYEKWIKDRNDNWFAITADGNLRRWDGTSFTSSPDIAHVGQSVYADPNRLLQAVVSLSAGERASLTELLINNGFRFVNSYHHNIHGSNEKWFQDRTGRWFALTPDGDLRIWQGKPFTQNIVVSKLSPLVYDDPMLLFNAPVQVSGSEQSKLSQLQTEHGFHFLGQYYLNAHGAKEKWFKDRTGQWFALTPNGELRKWQGASFTNSLVVANLSSLVYDDPTLLFDA